METVMTSKLSFVGVMMAILLLVRWAEGGVSLVKNGSFEADGIISSIATNPPQHWCDVSIETNKFGGYVNDEWSSHDGKSVTIYSRPYQTFSAGDMVTISQDVYLIDVNEVIFDVKLGTDPMWDDPWDPNKRSAVMLIDANVVWESNSVGSDIRGEYLEQIYDINEIYKDANSHTLSLGIRVNANETTFIEYRAAWDFVKFDTYCGGLGYLVEDLNRDCYVDMNDLGMLTGQWLLEDIYDLYEDEEDTVNFHDYGVFADGWLDNSDWENWGDDNCYQLERLEADFSGDGIVNFKDFGILADDWLTTGNCIGADIDCSGSVDWDDVSRMAGEWLMRDWLYGL
jgi:hypothetical protein